jgi:hypothetical protein
VPLRQIKLVCDKLTIPDFDLTVDVTEDAIRTAPPAPEVGPAIDGIVIGRQAAYSLISPRVQGFLQSWKLSHGG